MKSRPLDRDKIKVAVRRLPQRAIFEILERALDRVPHRDLPDVIQGHIPAADVVATPSTAAGLLRQVRAFMDASKRGDYYQEFSVDSKNCTLKSGGTQAWLAECERLFGLTTAAVVRLPPATIRQAYEVLFDVLRLMENDHRVIFWADEGGVYEVGIDWKAVLTGYFACLARTAAPDVFLASAGLVIKQFVAYDRERFIKLAHTALASAERDDPPG